MAPAAAAVPGAGAQPGPLKGRLKQSVARWCYNKIGLEDLARAASRMGLRGIDLINSEEWPLARKYGLVPAMTPGGGTIPDGLNRTENHDKIEREMRENIARAAAAGVPNVITFSGNRCGLSDDAGLDNCVIGLNRVKKLAEDHGVTICLELLNSKVDHKDYQCDHTRWGVEVIRRVDSPRVKLLYDIYHMQIMEGDVIRTIRENSRWIGHFHTAGNPGRKDMDDDQEMNYRGICRGIAATPYAGFVGHEFWAKGDRMAALRRAFEICNQG